MKAVTMGRHVSETSPIITGESAGSRSLPVFRVLMHINAAVHVNGIPPPEAATPNVLPAPWSFVDVASAPFFAATSIARPPHRIDLLSHLGVDPPQARAQDLRSTAHPETHRLRKFFSKLSFTAEVLKGFVFLHCLPTPKRAPGALQSRLMHDHRELSC